MNTVLYILQVGLKWFCLLSLVIFTLHCYKDWYCVLKTGILMLYLIYLVYWSTRTCREYVCIDTAEKRYCVISNISVSTCMEICVFYDSRCSAVLSLCCSDQLWRLSFVLLFRCRWEAPLRTSVLLDTSPVLICMLLKASVQTYKTESESYFCNSLNENHLATSQGCVSPNHR